MQVPGLTVAIPTMRRYDGFLKQTLPLYLENPLVKYVLICDETGEDADAIALEIGSHEKLIVHRNPKRLGIYYNKRQCIELAPTEWVAVFDSDNFFNNDFFMELAKVWYSEGAKPNHFYACGRGLFMNENGTKTNPIDGFGGIKLNRENWNDIFNKPRWNYMLNDGNWIVHKSVLAYLPTNVEDKDILATDAIYMARLFVQNGFTYDIREELFYVHTVHSGSSWSADVDQNMKIWNTTNWKL